VPQKITVAAWSWIGSKKVESLMVGKEGFFDPDVRRDALVPLLAAIEEADIVTGHNLIRFDLPVLNAECARLGFPALGRARVYDTIRWSKTKGLKKGQDDLSLMLGVRRKKKTMGWAEWDQAYGEDGWPDILDRCRSDVRMHAEMFQVMRETGRLGEPRVWPS
jgi:DNA polymerase elongation subunit (family B)